MRPRLFLANFSFLAALAVGLWLLGLVIPLSLAHWQHTRLQQAILEEQPSAKPTLILKDAPIIETHFLAHQRNSQGQNGWRYISLVVLPKAQKRTTVMHDFLPYGYQKNLPKSAILQALPKTLSGRFHSIKALPPKGLLQGPATSGREVYWQEESGSAQITGEFLRLDTSAFPNTFQKHYLSDIPPRTTLPAQRHRGYRNTWLLVALAWLMCGLSALRGWLKKAAK